MNNAKRDRRLEIHPGWLIVVFVGSVSAIVVSAAGWTLKWPWPDEFWRSVLVQLGIGGLLAAGGYVGLNLLKREAAIEREATVTAVREEVERLRPLASAPPGSSDTTAPELRRFEINPVSVDISSAPARVTLIAELSDEVSGVAGAGYRSSPTQVRFQSPSGQELDGLFEPQRNLVSGNPRSGVYEEQVEVPMHSESGTWIVAYFELVDQVGNSRRLTAREMEERGFPTSFEVRS